MRTIYCITLADNTFAYLKSSSCPSATKHTTQFRYFVVFLYSFDRKYHTLWKVGNIASFLYYFGFIFRVVFWLSKWQKTVHCACWFTTKEHKMEEAKCQGIQNYDQLYSQEPQKSEDS